MPVPDEPEEVGADEGVGALTDAVADETVCVTGALADETECVTAATACVTGAVADELVPVPDEPEEAGADEVSEP